MNDLNKEMLDIIYAKLFEALQNSRVNDLNIDRVINSYINLTRLQNDLNEQDDMTTLYIKYVDGALPKDIREELNAEDVDTDDY